MPESTTTDTWLCSHGNRHPRPSPGSTATCACVVAVDGELLPTAWPVQHHQALTDADLERTTLDDLRGAYRALRKHYFAEMIALVTRHDDITRRRDDLLASAHKHVDNQQSLLDQARTIMERDEQLIDRLSGENDRLSEIISYMRDHYSPLNGRGCALCVYEEGVFIRACGLHRWQGAKGLL